jgi:hypothetical protein
MEAPPAGAAAVSVTVPVGEACPTTLLEDTVSDDNVAGAGGGMGAGAGGGVGAGAGGGAGAGAGAGAGVGEVGDSSSPLHPAAAHDTARIPTRTSTRGERT